VRRKSHATFLGDGTGATQSRYPTCDKKSCCFELLIGNPENHLCRQMNLGEIVSLSDKVVKLRVKNLW